MSIIIMSGLPGVGKTTVAKNLSPLLDATLLSSDKIRKELIANPTYQRDERELVYQVMMLLAKYLHDAGKNCILDATFNKEEFRNQVKEKTNCPDGQFFIVECVCPEELCISRIKARKDDYSDADISVYQKMKKIYEPVKSKHITVDTSDDAKSNAEIIYKKIIEES